MSIKHELYLLTQDGLIEYIKGVLNSKNIKYKRDKYGNFWSFRFKGKPVFISHLDTVCGKLDENTPIVEVEGMLKRKGGGILGADDRAGVNLILNHIEDINFIFTLDEEIGCVGVKELSRDMVFFGELVDYEISCGIEFDRKGRSDIIGSDHGYCNKDLSEAVQKVLEPLSYKENTGVYTDVDYLMEYIPCVNLSCGYFNPHSFNEFLDIEFFKELDKYVIKLAEIEGEFTLADPENVGMSGLFGYSKKTYRTDYSHEDYQFDEVYVSCCGKFVHPADVVRVGKMDCCIDCVEQAYIDYNCF
jgi:hypothetical protein